ncbi:hypothetical protein GBF38_010119, partial [Nibea albiflora]
RLLFANLRPPSLCLLGSTDSCLAQQVPEAEHEAPSDVGLSGVSRARFLVFLSAPSPLGREHLWRDKVSTPVMRHTVW